VLRQVAEGVLIHESEFIQSSAVAVTGAVVLHRPYCTVIVMFMVG